VHRLQPQLKEAKLSQGLLDAVVEFRALSSRLRDSQKQLDKACCAYDALTQSVHEYQAQIGRLTQAHNEQTKLAEARQAQISQLTQLRDEQAQLAVERQARIETLAGDKTSLQTDLKNAQGQILRLEQELSQSVETHKTTQQALHEASASQRESQQENELLLLQLHQVQEELERYFLEYQAFRDEQTKLAADKQRQIDHLTKELERQAKDSQVQIALLTQARDEQARLLAERQAQIDKLAQAHDGQARLAAENQANFEAAQQKLQHTQQASLREAQQENELLLLQLHQVQEELERYFLAFQEAKEKIHTLDARWQKMLQRNPDYFECDALEAFEAQDGGERQAITWRIANLNAAGRALPELQFQTTIENGMAVFWFAQENSALLRWPPNLIEQTELSLSVVGEQAILARRVEALLCMAASDWELLKVLCRILMAAMQNPAMMQTSLEFERESLIKALAMLLENLEKFPNFFRFDQVSVKRSQVNPDYEHLWLRFENITLGGQRWPEFEFRLSCAGIRPGYFGDYPKLEFPAGIAEAVLGSWFIESYDDFGAKLELRFAQPQSMDMAIWRRLSSQDQAFISSLVEALPFALMHLQHTRTPLARAWEDWISMAAGVARILRELTQVQAEAAHPATEQKPKQIKVSGKSGGAK
jgi:chemotaxis protein histidine kinase CheA